MSSWNAGWARTAAPGVYSSGTSWRIRVRVADPRNQHLREMNRILDCGASLDEALERRESLRSELERQLREPPRRRVEEFGRHWLELKKGVLDLVCRSRDSRKHPTMVPDDRVW